MDDFPEFVKALMDKYAYRLRSGLRQIVKKRIKVSEMPDALKIDAPMIPKGDLSDEEKFQIACISVLLIGWIYTCILGRTKADDQLARRLADEVFDYMDASVLQNSSREFVRAVDEDLMETASTYVHRLMALFVSDSLLEVVKVDRNGSMIFNMINSSFMPLLRMFAMLAVMRLLPGDDDTLLELAKQLDSLLLHYKQRIRVLELCTPSRN